MGTGRRPVLHYTPPVGWLNDPVSLTIHDGRYHLFHQAVPESTTWGPAGSWGHATSSDLVTWSPRPTALAPGGGDAGCWAGCLCVPPGEPATAFYTAVAPTDRGLARIRVARAADASWDVWRKGAVVVLPPWGDRAQDELRLFRDPCVVPEGAGWRMLVGAAYSDGRAAVVSFTSPDLFDWTYAGCYLDRSVGSVDPVWAGSGWEAPQLLTVGHRDVLVVSAWHDDVTRHVVAAVGVRVRDRFVVDRWSRIGYGPGPYAPTAFTDSDGRPGLLFWLRDVADPAAGWAGALSLPYRLTLTELGDLRLTPHPAVVAAGPSAIGSGDGEALGLTWGSAAGPPSGGLDLRTTTGQRVVSLQVYGGEIEVVGTRTAVPLADGPVHVVLDRGIVEISTGRALLALFVESPPGALAAPVGDGVTLWWPVGG